jgi:hypothetical protein
LADTAAGSAAKDTPGALAGTVHDRRGQDESLTGFQGDAAAGDRTHADLGLRQILQHGQRDSELLGQISHTREDGGMRVAIPVREVEASHVHPALDQRPKLVHGRARGADGRDDLRQLLVDRALPHDSMVRLPYQARPVPSSP